MMKSKTKQVVFEMLEILMFLRNKAPKISEMSSLNSLCRGAEIYLVDSISGK
jgi:hypothetical protein